ncbi:10040_t:CDS:1, partial [Funneliformis caledonium]
DIPVSLLQVPIYSILALVPSIFAKTHAGFLYTKCYLSSRAYQEPLMEAFE